MVALGTGTVASAVLLGRPDSLGAIAACWGVAVLAGIAVGQALGSSHLNPAVSLSFALLRAERFPRRFVGPYALAQLAGGVLAGLLVLGVFGAELRAFEAAEGLVRGEAGSERAARMFGEYFPDPGRVGAPAVSVLSALAHEAIGAGALLLVVFLVSDPRRAVNRHAWLAASLVALTVTLVICAIAPITQAGINPARDLGPRLVAWGAGFGSVAVPGPHAGFWIYIVGPLVGGLAGAALSQLVPAPAGASSSSRLPVVLYVCVHNAGRSQMAAAWTRRLGAGRVEVRSAGSAPGERIHPNVQAVMAEVGVALDAVPRRITDQDLAAADVVVTMGCGDECVAKAGARREDWEIPDPKGKDLPATRAIRDDVRRRVEALLATLTSPRG